MDSLFNPNCDVVGTLLTSIINSMMVSIQNKDIASYKAALKAIENYKLLDGSHAVGLIELKQHAAEERKIIARRVALYGCEVRNDVTGVDNKIDVKG